MSLSIHPIVLGFNRCYVVRGERAILIDTGPPGSAAGFVKGIKRAAIEPQEIALIVVTHGHPDHIGSAKEIKDFTGASLAMHELEKECLEKGVLRVPPAVTAWGRLLMKLMIRSVRDLKIPSAKVEVVLGNEDFSLVEYGVQGRVIHTPGHSAGSVSVLLDTGEAFVGDLAMNGFPLRFGPGLPVFAEDLQGVKSSWKRMLERGATTVYPAHGKPFSAERIRRTLA
jgi:hydroxyacylglutathione hydrolase